MKEKINNIAGAILAGGNNSRMRGYNKAFLKIGNSTIIERSLNILKDIFSEVIIVTNSPQDYEGYNKDCRIISDLIKDIGPLGGVFSALSETTKEAVFFVACDMPSLHNELIRQQLEYFKTKSCDALLPRVNYFLEPLHAIYKKNLADAICRFAKENGNYSIREFLKTVNVCYWDLEDTIFYRDIFRNVNTEKDARVIQGLRYEDKIKGKIKGLA